MFTNEFPVEDEERYWTFITSKGKLTIAKVKVKHLWADKSVTGALMDVEVIENIYNKYYEKGKTINLSFAWTLQKTLEDARKLIFVTIFSYKGRESFFSAKPPWE